jgi:two-component system chemotaxis response regulator CheB
VRPTSRVDIVTIAVSTGGPKALAHVIPRMPANLPVPVVLVQHMPAVFTELLAERLDRESQVRVLEAKDGLPLQPGTVYIAPGGRHMIVERSGGVARVRCNDDPPENSCRPAADPLFRSVATHYGAGALGVVLTGMGSDGCKGAQVIVEAGGEVFVQDEATSVVWGMPGAVVHAGLHSAEVPLDNVTDAILTRVSRMRASVSQVAGGRS